MNKRRIQIYHSYLYHKGVDGMKWGYTDGKKNGKRVAGEEEEDIEKKTSKEDAGNNGDTDKKTKKKYTGKKDTDSMSKDDMSDLVNQVIRGNYGNGQDRVKALTEAGYDYKTVQGYVNDVLNGKEIDMSKKDNSKSKTSDSKKTTKKSSKKSTKNTVKKTKAEKIENVKKQVDELLKRLSELEEDDE